MQLIEALRIIRERQAAGGESCVVELCCGFTPLHLGTFLQAQLTTRLDDVVVEVRTGLFGDLTGNLGRVLQEPASQVAVLIEWSDLDPRLGYRSTGGWRPDGVKDILDTVEFRLAQFYERLETLAGHSTVAVSLPTVPLPPSFNSPGPRADSAALHLRSAVAGFAAGVATVRGLRVLDSQALEMLSPMSDRHDAAGDLRTGFPYSMSHAAALAESLARLLRPAPVMKGIITDLDNTFWQGIVGEDGVDGVSWNLDAKTRHHALYQEMLASLSDLGVLTAVASKNDPEVVAQALARPDLVCPADRLFPIEANWGPKSESIRRILQTWNIGADSVVFIDDSPIELAEVSANVPGIQCRTFPSSDEAGVVDLLRELRNLFGRTSVTEEDRLRRNSLKSSAALQNTKTDTDSFLAQAGATVTLEWNRPRERSFELINKTNQFNLNGRRLDESQWRQRLADPDGFVLAVSYQDKFGPLGQISVVSGRKSDGQVLVDCWVLSCRAFSRRIEHAVVRSLFEHFEVERLSFDFQITDRNGPLQTALSELLGRPVESGTVEAGLAEFESNCPRVFAEVITDDSSERNPRAA